MDHRNGVKLLKSEMQAQAAAEWFLCKIWNFFGVLSVTQRIF